MARYTGPKHRLARREGQDLYLKALDNPRANMLTREYPPGAKGQQNRTKMSDYGLQLREKQKVKRIYGVMEKQFRNYFAKAAKKKGITGHELLSLLERRLDNTVYRSGYAVTRAQARQMVSHGSVRVNGRKVNIPSFQVSVGDLIELKIKKDVRKKQILESYEKMKDSLANDWLEVDMSKLSSKVHRLPERSDTAYPIQEQLIVELYSK